MGFGLPSFNKVLCFPTKPPSGVVEETSSSSSCLKCLAWECGSKRPIFHPEDMTDNAEVRQIPSIITIPPKCCVWIIEVGPIKDNI